MTKYLNKSDAAVVRAKKSTVVEREIEKIYAEHQTLTPAMIVESALDEKSPLHRYFEWDNSKAADKYRLAQATQMIMATKFVCVLEDNGDIVPKVLRADRHSEQLVRKFLPAHGSGEGFVSRPTVLADAEMRSALIDRKKGILKSWCSGVVDIKELNHVRLAIENALLA